MTTDNSRYEEAANAAFPLDQHLVGTGHNSRMQDKRIGFLAGASFAEKQIQEEITRLQTTMIAAAEEIQEHWKAHCDEDGYGPANLMHRLEKGVSSGYPGYNAGQFTKMEEENRILKEALRVCIGELMYESTTGHWYMWARNNEAVPRRLLEIRKLIEP